MHELDQNRRVSTRQSEIMKYNRKLEFKYQSNLGNGVKVRGSLILPIIQFQNVFIIVEFKSNVIEKV